jgi:hypothetical protein
MKDPREYANGQEWWHASHAPDADMHTDICDRLDAKDAEIAALRDALEELMAWQNGPPLETYIEGWTKAMENAQRRLHLHGQR